MDDKGKQCPVTLLDCEPANCAWYLGECCAVVSLVRNLHAIVQALSPELEPIGRGRL